MITHLKIDGLRGILHAEVNDMTPLVIFVGPNGCGKSTFLDALMIGVSRLPVSALLDMMIRREGSHNRGEWLFHRKLATRTAEIGVRWTGEDGARMPRTTHLRRSAEGPPWVVDVGDPPIPLPPTEPGPAGGGRVVDPLAGPPTLNGEHPAQLWSEIKLLDMSRPEDGSLKDKLTAAMKMGRRKEIDNFLSAVLGPGFVSCQLAFEAQQTVVHLEFEDGTVPASVSGEGMYALVRMAIEIAATPGGAVLIEEPEAHQHPRNLELLAKMMWAAIHRGIQIVITTHSLEMIDLLVLNAPGERLDDLTLYHVRTHKDLHHLTRISGPDVKERLEGLGEDLR